MVDMTQPASAAEFTAAGATPEQAATLAEQHNVMAGRRGFDAKAAMSIAARDTPPPSAPAPAASPVTPVQAQSALEAHENAQLASELDKAFMPPASPSDYRFPPGRTDPTDEEFAQDNAIKEAFFREGLPRFLGENIAKSLVEGVNALERMTPEQAQQRVASTVESLKRMWGGEREYESNLAIVDRLLDGMAARHPALGVAETVRLDDGRDVPVLELLDPFIVNSLLEFAKHRGRR
jgi:hypothetical protein